MSYCITNILEPGRIYLLTYNPQYADRFAEAEACYFLVKTGTVEIIYGHPEGQRKISYTVLASTDPNGESTWFHFTDDPFYWKVEEIKDQDLALYVSSPYVSLELGKLLKGESCIS